MKKIFILMFMIFFITGCSANYELKFMNNKFLEEFSFVSTKSEDLNYYVDNNIIAFYNVDLGDMDNSLFCEYTKCYDKSINFNNDDIDFNISSLFEKGDISNSYLIRTLFRNVEINENDIKLSNIKNIFDDYSMLDEISIKFSTDKYVISGNYEKEENGIYYWFVNRNNYSNKNIHIEMSDSKIDSIISKTNKSDDTIINSFIYIILIIILIFFLILYIKIKNSNK